MSEPRETPDELELKKRARRRLVGAMAFATFAAVVLPMVMDEAPPPAGRDIELRIPGQDQVSSSPLAPGKSSAAAPAVKPSSVVEAVESAKSAVADSAPAAAAAAGAARKTEPQVAAKPAAAKAPVADPAPKAPSQPARAVETAKAAPVTAGDAKRAQAILEDQRGAMADAGGSWVVLIGAFANASNVKNLQTKLGQLGIKTYTESLDSSQGRKTRVRAGPFASRDAADKALEKMKRIGVGGVVAPKS